MKAEKYDFKLKPTAVTISVNHHPRSPHFSYSFCIHPGSLFNLTDCRFYYTLKLAQGKLSFDHLYWEEMHFRYQQGLGRTTPQFPRRGSLNLCLAAPEGKSGWTPEKRWEEMTRGISGDSRNGEDEYLTTRSRAFLMSREPGATKGTRQEH